MAGPPSPEYPSVPVPAYRCDDSRGVYFANATGVAHRDVEVAQSVENKAAGLKRWRRGGRPPVARDRRNSIASFQAESVPRGP